MALGRGEPVITFLSLERSGSRPCLYVAPFSEDKSLIELEAWLLFVPFDSRVPLTLSNLFSISFNVINSFPLMLLDPEEAEQIRGGEWGDRYFRITQR